jgi:streptomycin 6-kinase
MTRPALDVPADLQAKVAALGAEGERWLDGLDELLDDLVEEWELDVVEPLGVLKVAMPDGLRGNQDFASELLTLQWGGYHELLRTDLGRRAVLMERLGRPLAQLGLTVEAQIDVLARVIPTGWRRFDDNPGLTTGAEKATLLVPFIEDLWRETGGPCAERTVEVAVRLCGERAAALASAAPQDLVLVHGDAHPHNVLEAAAGDPTAFKLIDPEGLWSEPAHDLGIPLRGWNAEALATPDPVATIRGWAHRLVSSAGVDEPATVTWATIERVSTGLFLHQLGHERDARSYLAVADLVAAAD